jgi:hypothetical protein
LRSCQRSYLRCGHVQIDFGGGQGSQLPGRHRRELGRRQA